MDLTSHFEGETRVAKHFLVAPFEIPRGCTATYFPETNVLVPINSTAERSNTPTSKFVVISVAPAKDVSAAVGAIRVTANEIVPHAVQRAVHGVVTRRLLCGGVTRALEPHVRRRGRPVTGLQHGVVQDVGMDVTGVEGHLHDAFTEVNGHVTDARHPAQGILDPLGVGRVVLAGDGDADAVSSTGWSSGRRSWGLAGSIMLKRSKPSSLQGSSKGEHQRATTETPADQNLRGLGLPTCLDLEVLRAWTFPSPSGEQAATRAAIDLAGDVGTVVGGQQHVNRRQFRWLTGATDGRILAED